MTKRQRRNFMKLLKDESPMDLQIMMEYVQSIIDEKFWSDENFFNRECADGWIYMVVRKDLSYHMVKNGKYAYDEYVRDDDAIRIEAKDCIHLFPEYKVFMSKGELVYEG